MNRFYLLLGFLFLINIGFCSDACLIFFYQTGCSACEYAEPILQSLSEKYDNLIVDSRELRYIPENFELMKAYGDIYNFSESDKWMTPTIIINNKYFVGTSNLEELISAEIEKCENNSSECVCAFDNTLASSLGAEVFNYTTSSFNYTSTDDSANLTISAVISAALIDSFNPCAFAVIIFMLSYLSRTGNRKKMLSLGLVYIFSVFITYFVAGLSLLKIIQGIPSVSLAIKYFAIGMALITGIINIKDFFWYGKGVTLKIPENAKPIISRWTKKATIPAVIVLGFLVSAFELPCTGSVYLPILSLLNENVSNMYALSLLALYNIIFVIPLFAILIAVYFGVSSKKLENIRLKKRNYIKLITGLFLIILAAIMILEF